MSKPKNYVGVEFSGWKVNSFHSSSGKSRQMDWYNCTCKSCGVEYVRQLQNVRNTPSCLKCARPKGIQSPHWKGGKYIPGKRFRHIIGHARKRSIEFKVSLEYIEWLLERQDFKCAISGVPIAVDDRTASLDRIDSTGIYEEGNVHWVHKHINTMKWDLPIDLFIYYCNMVAEYNGKISKEA